MPKVTKTRTILLSSHMQLVIGFILPTIILLYFSDESRLGPLWAMGTALVFPLALEVYSFYVRRKPSYMSLFAIVGILIIGAITLLGLSEEWLALRRSVVYVIAALGLVLMLRFKREVVDKGLSAVINMDMAYKAANEKDTQTSLSNHISKTVRLFVIFLLLIGGLSYLVTILFITSPAGTSEFNTEYAQLRVLSIVFITVPFFVGFIGLLMYLASGIEKFTGLKTEELLKK